MVYRVSWNHVYLTVEKQYPGSNGSIDRKRATTKYGWLPPQSTGANKNNTKATTPASKNLPTTRHHKPNTQEEKDKDAACPFRYSPLYRSVYVYPNFGDTSHGWQGDMLSVHGQENRTPPWPWLEIDQRLKQQSIGHYGIKSREAQYATELLIRDILVHPDSCLRTNNPETATLFYIPYLPSVEFHNGSLFVLDYSTSPFGAALLEASEGNYRPWEETFGLTSKYWKRRSGSDHILVFSEPLHGLSHPRDRRGNYHTIHTQKQMRPPIVISVGVSTTFVEMHPQCARKNILLPYPNIDGRWYNGIYDQEVHQVLKVAGMDNVTQSTAALPAERALAVSSMKANLDTWIQPRPLGQFYTAGRHGTCATLRQSLSKDYKCAPSATVAAKIASNGYAHGYRMATFCPCPGGDSPAAKRMFDAILAGCIPLILSYDFVWPLTKEFDAALPLDPSEFSIRLEAKDHDTSRLRKNCTIKDESQPGLQAMLESIPASEIKRLRAGVQKAAELYSYFRRTPDLPNNPLRDGVLPNGGVAMALVEALSQRAGGVRWPACEEEAKGSPQDQIQQFKC
jgi:hypothetical protein